MSKITKHVVKLYLGSDHRGFELKEQIKTWLKSWNYSFQDVGAKSFNPEDDYPDFVSTVAGKVSQNPSSDRGIVLGHSGQGEAIVANKYEGIRAAVYYGGPKEIVKLSRTHNDANILSLGASFLSPEEAKEALKIWLTASFSSEPRHRRRIGKISEIENT